MFADMNVCEYCDRRFNWIATDSLSLDVRGKQPTTVATSDGTLTALP